METGTLSHRKPYRRYSQRKTVNPNNFAIRTGDWVIATIDGKEYHAQVTSFKFCDGDRHAWVELLPDRVAKSADVTTLKRISPEQAMMLALESQ